MEANEKRSPSFALCGVFLVVFDLLAMVFISLGRSWWQDRGIPPWTDSLRWMLFAFFAASSILTAAGIYACRRQINAGGRRFLIALALMTLALYGTGMMLKPVGSVDNYWNTLMSRGWTQYGRNPYLTTPNDLSDDPLFPRTAREWRRTSMMYGPLYVLAAAVPTVTLSNAIAAMLGMKALVNAGYIAGGLLLYRHLRRRKNMNANLFLAAWLLNPVGFFEIANAGHNEGLLVLPLSVMAVGLLEKRPRLVLPGLAAAALIKIWPACLLPAALGVKGTRIRDWLYGAAISAAMTVAAFAVFWHGWDIFQPLFNRLTDMNARNFSPGYALLTLATMGASSRAYSEHVAVITFFATLALALGTAVAGFLAWRGRISATGAARLIIAVFLLVSLNWLQPWYLLAALPFILPPGDDKGAAIYLAVIAGLGIFGFASYVASWSMVTPMVFIVLDIAAVLYLTVRAGQFLIKKRAGADTAP